MIGRSELVRAGIDPAFGALLLPQFSRDRTIATGAPAYDHVVITINQPTRRLHMGRIAFLLTLLALINAACSNSQTAGRPGYSDTAGKALLAPTEYSIDAEQRHHVDDYLPKGMGSR